MYAPLGFDMVQRAIDGRAAQVGLQGSVNIQVGPFTPQFHKNFLHQILTGVFIGHNTIYSAQQAIVIAVKNLAKCRLVAPAEGCQQGLFGRTLAGCYHTCMKMRSRLR